MKIVLSANTAWSVYNFRFGLIKALHKRGHTVIVVAPDDRYSDFLSRIGCETVNIKIDNRGNNVVADLITLLNYRRILTKVKPHVMLNFTVKPVIYGTLVAKSLGIPVVNTITGLGYVFLKENLLTKIVGWLYKQSLPFSIRVFVQNRDDKNLVLNRRFVQPEIVEYVPGSGVDLVRFSASTYPGDDQTRFLLVSRLYRDKGIIEYVEAARYVRSKVKNVHFQLLGSLDSEQRSAVKQSMLNTWASEGVIEYLGETEDVRPFIRQAHCLVLPSYREGLPRSLIEGAAMAKPVITTDVPGCREVVIPNKSGYLCKPQDSLDLAEKMLRFVVLPSDEKRKMGLCGQDLISNQFNQDRVINQYLSVIEKLKESQ